MFVASVKLQDDSFSNRDSIGWINAEHQCLNGTIKSFCTKVNSDITFFCFKLTIIKLKLLFSERKIQFILLSFKVKDFKIIYQNHSQPIFTLKLSWKPFFQNGIPIFKKQDILSQLSNWKSFSFLFCFTQLMRKSVFFNFVKQKYILLIHNLLIEILFRILYTKSMIHHSRIWRILLLKISYTKNMLKDSWIRRILSENSVY